MYFVILWSFTPSVVFYTKWISGFCRFIRNSKEKMSSSFTIPVLIKSIWLTIAQQHRESNRIHFQGPSHRPKQQGRAHMLTDLITALMVSQSIERNLVKSGLKSWKLANHHWSSALKVKVYRSTGPADVFHTNSMNERFLSTIWYL